MNNEANIPMNIVKVNINNGDKNEKQKNSKINYQELNAYNNYKENDNSAEGFTNPQDEVEEEQEPEELSMAEIEHLKKIHEQTLLRTEKYANLYSSQKPEKKPVQNNDLNEKVNNIREEVDTSHNILEILNENDNEHINEQKINPNKERIFRGIHCYFYLNSEPLIIIGPDLGYFIWIFTFVSFFSIFVYSLKTSSYFTSFLFIVGYLFFSGCYFLLMIVNPGIPTEKKHFDINDLNYNYIQCKICNCIYHKDNFRNVHHCQKCGICVEGSQNHYNFATKCIGKNNKKIFQAWTCSCIALAFIMFLYLIF
jgi:hypothetical protein